MDGEVVQVPTIQSVNDKLLKEIDKQLDSYETLESLSIISDSVAKLNSSYKNNDIFPKPETKEERAKRELQDALKGAMNG